MCGDPDVRQRPQFAARRPHVPPLAPDPVVTDASRPVGWHPGLGDIDASGCAQGPAVGERDGPQVRGRTARVDAETWHRGRMGLLAAPGLHEDEAQTRRGRVDPCRRDDTGPARPGRRVRHGRGVSRMVRETRAPRDRREVAGAGPQPAPDPRSPARLRQLLRVPHRAGQSRRSRLDPRDVRGARLANEEV